jgi:hypothetical protein
MSEKKGVLRKLFHPNKEEATKGEKNNHNQTLHTLDTSSNIKRMIKLRMRCARNVESVRKKCIQKYSATRFGLSSIFRYTHTLLAAIITNTECA